MARPLRVEYPGAYYHITTRGVARQDIFFREEDRRQFLDYVSETQERFGLVLHGYCLMGNHYHLEVETPEGELSRPLQWLNHRYASYVNRSYDRVGHLFQGRFKSAVIEAKRHLCELSRYIHLNPVRAGLVRHPGDYPWSSYRAFLGLMKRPHWLEIDGTLRRWGTTREKQRRAYRTFVEEPEEVVQDPLRELEFGLILGTAKFVGWIRTTFCDRESDSQVAQLAKARPATSLATVCQVVCSAYECDQEVLLRKRKHNNEARDVALYMGRHHARRKLTELGERFGGMSTPAVSLACKRVEDRMAGSRTLRSRLKQLEAQLTTRPATNTSNKSCDPYPEQGDGNEATDRQ